VVVAMMDQTLLDEITTKLSGLSRDDLLCVCVNSIVAQQRCSAPSGVVSHVINLAVTISALMPRDEKIKCVTFLRDAADMYEHSIFEFEKLN
jgi:hypothetical protein